jgi:glycosyltransferase involved in cell wall biosynthesis
MAAGIDVARGRILVTMDGDLQNDPDDIPVLVDRLNEGYDIVVGWRHKRQDRLVTRKIPSVIANWIIGKITGVPIKDNGCSLKVYRADVMRNVPLYSEMHRFIPAMASITGAKIAQVKVRHHARQFGESKYGLSRIYKVILDLIAIKTIIGFAGRPLAWFATLSFPFILLTAIFLPVSFYYFLSDKTELALTFAGITLVLGSSVTFFIALGILGELVFRTGNKKPDQYIIATPGGMDVARDT